MLISVLDLLASPLPDCPSLSHNGHSGCFQIYLGLGAILHLNTHLQLFPGPTCSSAIITFPVTALTALPTEAAPRPRVNIIAHVPGTVLHPQNVTGPTTDGSAPIVTPSPAEPSWAKLNHVRLWYYSSSHSWQSFRTELSQTQSCPQLSL